MNRIEKTFKELKKEKKKAFIPYVTVGDPDMKTSEEIIQVLAASGADVIELGIPFSDPLADGPTIQEAIQRSLKAGCSVKKTMAMVKRLRKKMDTPFVFMTYYNIVFNYGVSRFIRDSIAVGADGIIVPDLPMEEADELIKISRKEGFSLIMLTAPTTPPARFRKIAACSRGFIYHVSLTGVTGTRKKFAGRLKEEVRKLSKLTTKSVCVGFGISNLHQAKDIAAASDGVIVGSAIIKVIERNLKSKSRIVKEVSAFASSLAKAVHRA